MRCDYLDGGSRLAFERTRSAPEDSVNAPKADEWTVKHWRIEPRWRVLEDVDEPPIAEQTPPLWKDLTVASIAAVLLWGSAVVLFG